MVKRLTQSSVMLTVKRSTLGFVLGTLLMWYEALLLTKSAG
jgi:hypothetical protein